MKRKMNYFIHAPDDNTGRAVVKDEKGWIFCRVSLQDARLIVAQLNKP